MPIPVQTVCPECGDTKALDQINDEQKQFLLESTSYHELYTELCHLKTIDQILRRFPGTKNRLIVSKTKRIGDGHDDPEAVKQIIRDSPGLHDFLAKSSFLFSARFPAVAKAVGQTEGNVQDGIMKCERCGHQYLILPFDYYMACG
ncbi:hypothetical protein [Allorhodopirellula heiligendammensis]|uniref:hypothetical protein n=1 Tax=Allorhodopirellula heiligendammensis TaxID=2714739 RepID=UPI0011B7AD75|nr:hypothetical protein [Allorhodopirellula heiligendammensis]